MSRRSAASSSATSRGLGTPGGHNNNNNSAGAGTTTTTGPPSHPMEHHPDHRAFLMRSLKRNDVDLAAIVELNASLHSVKEEILRTCGEVTMLHLGEGRLTLHPDADRLVSAAAAAAPDGEGEGQGLPSEEGQELCVDFLLRMKLRRKLLNRLSRRLNRVAHAMDGNDVAPPGPPRYGDLRLHIDEREVQDFAEARERQERAIRAIQEQREKQSIERSRRRLNNAVDPPQGATEEGPPPDKKKEDEDSSELSAEPEAAMGDPPSTASGSSPGAAGEEDVAIDYDVLRSYDDAYEKRIDPATGATRYTLLDRPPVEEDHSKIRFGGGIGATHRSMSTKEKEAEFHRWQASLLARVPDQPTFAEAGMDNRVFFLEERRKRALEAEAKNRKLAAAADESGSDSETAEVMALVDVDDDDGAEPSAKNSGAVDDDEAVTEKEIKGEDNPDVESKSSDEKVADTNPAIADDRAEAVAIKKVKPISLAAVPSFHEQDSKRIKLIHYELVSASILEQSRKRLEEVTRAYNQALRNSLDWSSRRDQGEAQLQKILYQAHSMDPQAMGAISATENWMRAKQHFENDELNKVLPSRWGSIPAGTNATKEYGRKPDGVSQHVANCLADIVDSVAMISTGQLRPMQRYPIPYPRGESHIDALKSVEAHFRRDIAHATAKLRQSEEDRHKAWRKMLRTKAECDLPHHGTSSMVGGYSARMRGNLTLHNYHQLPLPSLRMSLAESVPHELSNQRPVQASYVPPRAHAPPPSTSTRVASESRYSSARVKERIGHDGTVAPVSEPKKSKDGLYLRPAGRTRKGMEWDAVHGVWVPSSHGTE